MAHDDFRSTEARLYEKERGRLIRGEESVTLMLDKSILFLASGTLALSITVVKDLTGKPEGWLGLLLISSWVCSTIAIVACIFSIRASKHAHERFRQILDEQATIARNDASVGGDIMDPSFRRYNDVKELRHIDRWNQLAFLTFVLGILTLTVFTGVSYWKRIHEQQTSQAADPH